MGILLLSSSQKLTNYFFLPRTKQIIRKFGNLLFPANKSTPAAVHGYLVSKGCLRGVQKASIQGVQSKYVLMFTIGHVNFFLKKECCQKKWPLHYFGWGWGWRGVGGGGWMVASIPDMRRQILTFPSEFGRHTCEFPKLRHDDDNFE